MSDVTPVELAVPFQIGADGAVATVSDPSVIMHQHVKSVVGTQKGERVMLSDYGADVQRFLFASNDQSLQPLLQSEINNALHRWEPLAKFQGATMDVDQQSGVGHISVLYQNATSNDPVQTLTLNVNTGQ